MSFYGKIYNYISNVFHQVQAQTYKPNGEEEYSEIQSAGETGGTLIFAGDQTLSPEITPGQGSSIIVRYAHKENEGPNPEALFASGKNVSTEAVSFGIQVPNYDSYGHARTTGSKILPVFEIEDDSEGNIKFIFPTEGKEDIAWIGSDYYTRY